MTMEGVEAGVALSLLLRASLILMLTVLNHDFFLLTDRLL